MSLLSLFAYGLFNFLALVLILGYLIRLWWIKRVIEVYEKIPLPSLDDFSEKTAKFGLPYLLGSSVGLTPDERISAYRKMGKPKMFKARLLHLPIIVTTSKEDFSLASTLRKAPTYKPYENFLGRQSILFQTGDKARKERSMLNKGFGQHNYRAIHSTMVKIGDRILNRILTEEIPKNKNLFFYANDVFPRAALEVIAEGGFGFPINLPENQQYLDALRNLFRIPGNPICQLPFGAQIMMWKEKECLQTIHGLIDKTVNERVQLFKEQGKNETDQRGRDLLDFVIEASMASEDGKQVSLQWIRDQIQLLFVGGSDTTGTTLCWVFNILAYKQDIQNKVKEEIKKLESSDPKLLDYDLVNQMSYADAVIKETLRLYPPIFMISRRLNDDETDFRGIPVKKEWNAIIECGILYTNRDEEYFPNPDEFNPERWRTPGGADFEAFGSFSFGFRQCLGKNFSILEMKTFIWRILREHTICPAFPDEKFPELVVEDFLSGPNKLYGLVLKRDE